jgi:hypothetical protein
LQKIHEISKTEQTYEKNKTNETKVAPGKQKSVKYVGSLAFAVNYPDFLPYRQFQENEAKLMGL